MWYPNMLQVILTNFVLQAGSMMEVFLLSYNSASSHVEVLSTIIDSSIFITKLS